MHFADSGRLFDTSNSEMAKNDPHEHFLKHLCARAEASKEIQTKQTWLLELYRCNLTVSSHASTAEHFVMRTENGTR